MKAFQELLENEFSTRLYFIPAYSPELNRIEMIWKQMKYHWRDFKVMSGDQIKDWVYDVSSQFGVKYMFNF
nr:transposase [Acinetobacter sp. 251-1]